MKKLILFSALVCLACLGTTVDASAQTKKPIAKKPVKATTKKPAAKKPAAVAKAWKKSPSQTWPGQGEYIYKLRNGTLMTSRNGGIDWAPEVTGLWSSKEGKGLYKVAGGKVMLSKDGGNSWAEAPNGAFRAYDGKLYKFDAAGTLMVQ